MKRKLISSGSPYEPQIGFSRAVRVGNLISVAGTAPIVQVAQLLDPDWLVEIEVDAIIDTEAA